MNKLIVLSIFIALISCNEQKIRLASSNTGSSTCPKSLSTLGVYGKDERIEYYEIPTSIRRKIARSAVTQIETKYLNDLGNGMTEIKAKTYQERYNVCASERFSQQPSPARCGGALVGKDLVLTAGHCYLGQSECDQIRFVFEYQMKSKDNIPTFIPTANIYKCKEVLHAEAPIAGGTYDYAVVRLDREVKDRPPLRIRRSGKVPNDARLFLMGHPRGIVQKYVGDGIVRTNTDPGFFVTNLDSYANNSGSPVFNEATNLIEGVLVRGEPDFESQGTCAVTKVCADTACRGQDVNRVDKALAFIPDVPDIVDDPPPPSPTPGSSPVPEPGTQPTPCN